MNAAVERAAPQDPRAARDTARFLLHLLTSANPGGDGFVPVPAKVIEKYCRRADRRALDAAGLVEVNPYSREARLCREFRVTDGFRLAFFEAGPTADRVRRDGLVNLVSGKRTQARTKSRRRTASGNPPPPKVRAAIDAVNEVPFLPFAIEAHLGRLRADLDAAATEPERVAALGRYLNDTRCYHAVMTQGARPLGADAPDGLWVYRPAYQVAKTGRLSQIGGGLQSCSAAMKAVAYPSTVPQSP